MTYLIRWCSVRMTFRLLRRRIRSGQGKHSLQKDTMGILSREERSGERRIKWYPFGYYPDGRSCQLCAYWARNEQLRVRATRACVCNGLRPILCSQLAQDTGDMFLGSGERDHQLIGDLLIGGPFCEQVQDLPLTWGERLKELLRSLGGKG